MPVRWPRTVQSVVVEAAALPALTPNASIEAVAAAAAELFEIGGASITHVALGLRSEPAAAGLL